MHDELMDADLNDLEILKEFTLESKLLMCQQLSCRIMTASGVDIRKAYEENIMPWELETFTAYSILFDDASANKTLDVETFSRCITLIRNYWPNKLSEAEKDGVYPETFIMISALQQYPVQGVYLQKLFRSHYFFTFTNENLDMKKIFNQKMGVEYERLELFAFVLFFSMCGDLSGEVPNEMRCKWVGNLLKDSEVCTLLSINIDDYKKQLEDLNGKSVEDQFYGLKTQYIYPLIEKENIIYIPSPYLVINAVTESMLNRITFGDEQLRREFGKEVIESYLYDIASQVKTVSWISKEIVYNVGHQEIRSPDVLVGEGEKMTFYDTKAFSPSLRLRSLDRTEIENDIARYAKNVIQLYKQIVNYLAGKFELDKHYEKKDIFGVVVVLEDAVVSRKKVYDKVFLELERTAHLDDEEKRYIHSHIKVLPLREVETFMLQNMSPLPFLVEQVENENQWDNYRYGCPQKENGLIAEYESYVKKLKSMLIARIRTV